METTILVRGGVVSAKISVTSTCADVSGMAAWLKGSRSAHSAVGWVCEESCQCCFELTRLQGPAGNCGCNLECCAPPACPTSLRPCWPSRPSSSATAICC